MNNLQTLICAQGVGFQGLAKLEDKANAFMLQEFHPAKGNSIEEFKERKAEFLKLFSKRQKGLEELSAV